jgi:very-short-patch-repair endonuclease
LDGDSHFTDAGEKYDEIRSQALANWRISVIRFTNSDVLQQFEAVCAKIDEALANYPAP